MLFICCLGERWPLLCLAFFGGVMKQMPYEPGSGRSTAPGAHEIKFHYERLASDPRRSSPTSRVVPLEMTSSC